MTKLDAYEAALTLYGKIFSQLSGRNARYFFGTIKRDFVFFLFALIWKGAGGASELKSKSRLIPKNFNEWTFGNRTILSSTGECFSADLRPVLAWSPPKVRQNRPSLGTPRWGRENEPKNTPQSSFCPLWNVDRDYFRENAPPLRNSDGIAVLGCGIDFEKSFELNTLAQEREIRAVVKKSLLHDIQSLPFFLQNFIALFAIYSTFKKNCILKCSLVAFLRYFVYYAFASARFRTLIKDIAKNSDIGKVMSSDLDNVIGNSFILWSRFYGMSQIAYPHGSPVSLNKNRYFEPEEYYIWTVYQKKYAQETSSGKNIKFINHPPKWAAEPAPTSKNGVHKIVIVTAMEENLEIPFGNREALLAYMEEIAKFAATKNILVYIKSHKLLDWHSDYDALCRKYSNVTHVKKRWKTEQLQDMDIGILMNTSTTMALQMLSLGIPTITCSEVMSEIVPKHFSAPYLPHLVPNKQALLRVLEQLLLDKEFYKQAQRRAVEIFRGAILE